MITKAKLEQIKEICADPNSVSYCVIWDRPGVLAWCVEVEYTKFKPDTDANDLFHIAIMIWPEKSGMTYSIITFDKSMREYAESILWKNGLKKVKDGYIQTSIGPNGIEAFPLMGPNIFYLENHSKGAPNVIYSNDPVKIKKAHEHEMEQCQKFWDEHKAWLETPEGKASFDAYWAKHPEGYNL